MHARMDPSVDHDRRRIDIEGRQDTGVGGALDRGGSLAELPLNLRVIHRATAVGTAVGSLDARHEVLHRIRKGLAVVWDRDHDGHPRASSICRVATRMVQALPSSRLAHAVGRPEIPLTCSQ